MDSDTEMDSDTDTDTRTCIYMAEAVDVPTTATNGYQWLPRANAEQHR